MEESINRSLQRDKDTWMTGLEERFALPDCHPSQMSPLALAYVGDAVYELLVRTVLVRTAQEPVQRLHRKSSSLVKAETQSRIIAEIEPLLHETEAAVYHRGRNAKANTKAKNADIVDYRRATGLEALFGYLYLAGETERLQELVRTGLEAVQPDDSPVNHRHPENRG